MKKIVMFTAAVILFISCNKGAGKKIPVNEMKKVMWDMVCADELYASISATDSTLKTKKDNFRLYEQVFAAHKISKEAFYSSLHYYELHTDEFKVLMDSVQSYGSSQKNKPVKPALKTNAK